jgi:hypothetical protein
MDVPMGCFSLCPVTYNSDARPKMPLPDVCTSLRVAQTPTSPDLTVFSLKKKKQT